MYVCVCVHYIYVYNHIHTAWFRWSPEFVNMFSTSLPATDSLADLVKAFWASHFDLVCLVFSTEKHRLTGSKSSAIQNSSSSMSSTSYNRSHSSQEWQEAGGLGRPERWHGTGYSTAHGPLHSMMSARHCTAPWSSAEHPFHQVLTQRHAWNPRHSKWNLPKAPKFGLGRSLGAVARWVQSKRHRRHSQFWCLMGLMDGLWSPHPGHPCLELTRWELRSDLHTQSCHQHRPTRSLRFQERCYHLTARITSLYPNQNSTKYANVCKELGGLVLKTRDKFQSFKTVPERMQSRHIKTSNPVLKVDDDNSSALN